MEWVIEIVLRIAIEVVAGLIFDTVRERPPWVAAAIYLLTTAGMLWLLALTYRLHLHTSVR